MTDNILYPDDAVIYSGRAIGCEPTPGQRITEIHCWIATYPDRSEGIIASSMPGLGLTPLMSSRRDVALGMAPLAEMVAKAAAQQTGHETLVRLVTFRAVDPLAGGGTL